MANHKYNELKKYLYDLKDNLKTFKYRGELSQTYKCLCEIFCNDLHKIAFIKNEHDNNDYLFDQNKNQIIDSCFNKIDLLVDEYIEMGNNTQYNASIVDQMDKIGMEILKFETQYIELIKMQMSEYLE